MRVADRGGAAPWRGGVRETQEEGPAYAQDRLPRGLQGFVKSCFVVLNSSLESLWLKT